MNAKQLTSLWIYLQSLPLTEKNKKWLADRLLDKNKYITKQEILAGIDAGLKDMIARKTRPAEKTLEELIKEL